MARNWGPTQDLMRLQERMNRLFSGAGFREEGDELLSGSWTPPCDIIETKDALILRAEVPGVRQEDIDIQVEGGVLTIRGQRSLEKETEERSYHRVERAYGTFVRSFTLGRSVDPERISADYRDGILEVTMPKREETKPRQIKIGIGGGAGGGRSMDTTATAQGSAQGGGQRRQG